MLKKKDLGGAFKICANIYMWAVNESARPLTNLVKGILGALSLLVSSGDKQIIPWARWCWGPDILTECIFFFVFELALCTSSSLVPWTDSPFGSAVSIAHLLIQFQGWSTGELRLTSPFQIHTKPAGQEFPLEHKDGSVTCWGVGTGWYLFTFHLQYWFLKYLGLAHETAPSTSL